MFVKYLGLLYQEHYTKTSLAYIVELSQLAIMKSIFFLLGVLGCAAGQQASDEALRPCGGAFYYSSKVWNGMY